MRHAHPRHCIAATLCLVATALLIGAARAAERNDYPTRPMRLIVPFPPGGADTVARLVGQKLAERLGQPLVIDNRPGAGGVLGTGLAAKAAADGYTILFATSALAIAPAVHAKLPYDTLKDLDTVALLAHAPLVLVVHPSVPANSVKELIALARAKPGSLNYASNGAGSITFLAAELFKSMAGVRIVEIAYKGAGPSLTALLAGEVHMMVAPLGPSLAHVRTGRLRALAIPTAQRSSLLPDLPTVAEAGLPGYEAVNWYGAAVPQGTAARVVGLLNEHLVASVTSADVREKLAAIGYEAAPSSPADFATFLRAEIVRWTNAMKAAGIRPE